MDLRSKTRKLKAILPFALAISIGLPADLTAATWTSLGPAASVLSVGLDAQNPQILYATLSGTGVWKTVDGGSTWMPASSGLPLPGDFWIAVDPSNSSIAYASGSSAIYKTVTGGAMWFPATSGLPAASLCAVTPSRCPGRVEISPSGPANLLVALPGVLYKSQDGAATWHPVGGLPSGRVWGTFRPDSSTTMIAGVSAGTSAGLFRSLNGGSTWSPLSIPISNASVKSVGPIAFDSQFPAVLYVQSTGCGFGCFSTLYRSADGGSSWAPTGLSRTVGSIAVDVSSAITASDGSTVFRSVNGGQVWAEFGDGLAGRSVNSLEARSRTYAGTDLGVFVSNGPPPTRFFTVSPCRVADSREPDGPYGGPALSPSENRPFVIRGRCAIPETARAVAFNLTVVQPTSPGHLIVFWDYPPSLASVMNWGAGQTRANNTILGLGDSGEILLHIQQASGSVHILIDVSGYFE